MIYLIIICIIELIIIFYQFMKLLEIQANYLGEISTLRLESKDLKKEIENLNLKINSLLHPKDYSDIFDWYRPPERPKPAHRPNKARP